MLKKISLGLILASLVSTSALADGAHKHESKDKEFVLKARAGWLHSQHKSEYTSSGVALGESNINHYIGEIALDYFFTKNIALEGSVGYGAIDKIDNKTIKIIPVSALIQYHFMPESTISPYIGAGYSYQFPNNISNMSLKSAGGVVGQLGLDIPYNDTIGFNIDAKYTYNVNHKDTITVANTYVNVTNKVNTTAVTAGVSFTF